MPLPARTDLLVSPLTGLMLIAGSSANKRPPEAAVFIPTLIT